MVRILFMRAHCRSGVSLVWSGGQKYKRNVGQEKKQNLEMTNSDPQFVLL